jgi:hypothetical protein
MRSVPVDFRWLRAMVESAEFEVVQFDDRDEARQILRSVLTQVDLYDHADAGHRDRFRGMVELAVEHPQTMMSAVRSALDDWVFDSATTIERDHAQKAELRRVHGKIHGARPKRDAAERHAEWIEEGRAMHERNPHRSFADIGRALAAQPGETIGADQIARVVREALKQKRG